MSARVSWWRTDFGEPEIDQLAAAVRSECISQGQLTDAFEMALGELLGVDHVIATTSGSMALLMACLALGIGSGDEVIVPNRTWIATAHAPQMLGARVVLADVEPTAPLIDPAAVERLIGPRTRAIIPVHLNGRASNLDALLALGQRYGIPIIEDASQALACGGPLARLGTRGTMGCFSLSVAKLISTGQGGFVITRDRAIAQRLRKLRTHGLDSVLDARWEEPGFNFRFTDLQAAVGLAQLERLPARIEALRALHARYMSALAGHPQIKILPAGTDGFPLYVEALCPQREALLTHLEGAGIEARRFYPDLDRARYLHAPEPPRHSRRYEEQGVFLPSGPAQPEAAIEYTLAVLRAFCPSRQPRRTPCASS